MHPRIKMTDSHFQYEFSFPAIKGIQAGKEYFVSMCPLKLIPKIFVFDEEEILPELRAQRLINRSRIPDISSYITKNKDSYVFSALTASVDGETAFDPAIDRPGYENIGNLHISMEAQVVINDGQHRRAAIENALKEEPALGNETIAVVFFIDEGLKRCQQMFADLNRYAVKPSRSIGVLYDHRDEISEVSRHVVATLPFFRGLVEMEKTTLAPRSKRLFAFSALYGANVALLADLNYEPDEAAKLAAEYWSEVSQALPEWNMVRNRQITSREVREDFIHTHGVVLHAIGRAGNALFKSDQTNWQAKIKGLEKIDWSRGNRQIWEGRAMQAGRLSKANRSMILTANVIKTTLGLELKPDEQRLEAELMDQK